MIRVSQLSLLKKILLSNFARLSEPYKITFSVTNRCNSRCRTCNIWKAETKNELTTKEIIRIFRNVNSSWINLTGGEAFMRDDLMDIAHSIREHTNPHIFNITTNGLMTKKIVETVEGIMELDFPRFLVVVSIDGPEGIHDRIRGVKGAWKRSLETYRRLRELHSGGIDVFIGYTISEFNLGSLEEAYLHVKRILPDVRKGDFHVNLFHTSPHYYRNEGHCFEYDKEELLNEISVANSYRAFDFSPISLIEKRYLDALKTYMMTGKVPLSCMALSSSCFIGPSGSVYPCIHLDKKVGNLRESDYDLSRIWNSDKARKVRRDVLEGRCPGCWTPCEAYQAILGNMLRIRKQNPLKYRI